MFFLFQQIVEVLFGQTGASAENDDVRGIHYLGLCCILKPILNTFQKAQLPSEVEATTKCQGWQFTDDGLEWSRSSSSSMVDCGLRPPRIEGLRKVTSLGDG